MMQRHEHHHREHRDDEHCNRCALCRNAFNSNTAATEHEGGGGSEGPSRLPISSKSCNHIICLECALNVHLQEEAKSDNGSPTALPWMDCPACHASYAFNANELGGSGGGDGDHGNTTSPPFHYARTVSAQESTPHSAAAAAAVAAAVPPHTASYHHRQHHHHHPHYSPPHYHHGSPSTPYYAAPPSHYHHHPASSYVSPTQDPHQQHTHHHPTTPYRWQTMDYSPESSRQQQQQHVTPPIDFRPPAPPPNTASSLSPPDIRRLNVHHHAAPARYPPPPPHSPVSLPRKRLRTPIAKSARAYKAMARTRTMSEDLPEEEEPTLPTPSSSSLSSPESWLKCRICQRPVVVTCQRLLSGPSPDHEALWPQVRLGKRLAAALRQHNQQYHPDWFMWNVKGRAAMTCSLANNNSADMEEDDAVAQTALVKALEASFEHLPHISGVDDYETKTAFLSRTLRRIGFAYAYISYTSSEWTKWQQWKKDCYSRVQIQAKARQLLDRYECNVKEAIDDQWPEISSLEHQEKLDLFQNIFVLPQCIFECLNHSRFPVRYGDVTDGSSL